MVNITIRKRYRNNGVVYEYRFEIASVDGKRQWKSKSGFKTATEARRAGKAALQIYENAGVVAEKDEISVSDYMDNWIVNDCMVDLMPNTVFGYKKIVDNYIKPRLGSYRLKSLNRDILQAFITDMFDLGYSYNMLVSIKCILTKSMNYAEDHHYIQYSPAVRLKIPRNRRPKIPTRSSPHYFIPKETIMKIFEKFPEGSSFYIPLRLGYECGLRLGEVYGLCWEDIDLKNKVIYINRQIQWLKDNNRDNMDKTSNNGTSKCGDGYWYFCPPKYKSYRVIEISNSLAELLSREKIRQERAKEYYNALYIRYDVEQMLKFDGKEHSDTLNINRISSEGYGFPIHPLCVRENGTLISPRTTQHFSTIIRRDITPEFDFHSLRKTHASMLAEKGVDQKYIQTRLGHANIDITINVYESVTGLMRERGRDALNKLYQ